ncbi:MAG: putative motility protein [Pirellulaceae bacterium]|nr:putative motility protein [Pirellulaceae bacterium]
MDCDCSYSAASAIQQAKVAHQISTAIAKKTLDAQRQQGLAAVSLLQQAAEVARQMDDNSIDVQL